MTKSPEDWKKHFLTELKENIREKKPEAPVEEILAVFCERHAISVEDCKKYYDQLVASGEIQKVE